MAATCVSAHAQGPAQTDAVYACTSIEIDAERLACYDEAVGRLKTAEESGEITTVSRAQVEEVRRDAFGFSLPSLPSFARSAGASAQPDALDSVTVAVSEIDRNRYDMVTVTLENGQVWRQIDGRRVVFSARLGVEEAEIKRAALGSYRMKLDGGRAFRVKRVQ